MLREVRAAAADAIMGAFEGVAPSGNKPQRRVQRYHLSSPPVSSNGYWRGVPLGELLEQMERRVHIEDDPAPDKRFLTTTKASQYIQRTYGFDVSAWTLLRWTKVSLVKAHRRKDAPGYRYHFSREELDKLMASMDITPVS